MHPIAILFYPLPLSLILATIIFGAAGRREAYMKFMLAWRMYMFAFFPMLVFLIKFAKGHGPDGHYDLTTMMVCLAIAIPIYVGMIVYGVFISIKHDEKAMIVQGVTGLYAMVCVISLLLFAVYF